MVGKHWTDLVDMHQKYGNVVRIGPDEVSFVSAQSWKTIHGTGSNSFQRDPNLMAVLQKATDTLGSADRETHRLFRNLVAPVFSDSSLRTQEPVIVEVAQRMVYALKERCGTPVDISLVFQWALIDVMGELMLGQSFDCLKNFESPTWVSLMATGKKSFAVIQMVLSFTVPALLYKAILHLPVVQKWIQSLELTKEKTKQRLDRGASARRDVMTLMWEEAQGASMIITRDRVERLGSLLFFVGYETTATALSGIIWGLLAAPEAYRRLTDEIRDLRKEDLRPATLLSLSYLNGVIQEGLRSHNPVGIAVTRIVPKGGAFIDGYHLPEGVSDPPFETTKLTRLIINVAQTKCGIPHWASSNLPRHFHEPSKFFPERWLPEEDLRFKSDVLEVVQAFGRGSMGCIGKQSEAPNNRKFHDADNYPQTCIDGAATVPCDTVLAF